MPFSTEWLWTLPPDATFDEVDEASPWDSSDTEHASFWMVGIVIFLIIGTATVVAVIYT